MTTPQVTVGLDISTSSVKAIAADHDGKVVAAGPRRASRTVHMPLPRSSPHERDRGGGRPDPRSVERRARRISTCSGSRRPAMVPARWCSVSDHHGGGTPGLPSRPAFYYSKAHGRATSGGEGRRTRPRAASSSAFSAGPRLKPTPPASRRAGRRHAPRSPAKRCSTPRPRRRRSRCSTGRRATDRGCGQGAAARSSCPRLVPTGWEAGRIDGDGAPPRVRLASTPWRSSSSPAPTMTATSS